MACFGQRGAEAPGSRIAQTVVPTKTAAPPPGSNLERSPGTPASLALAGGGPPLSASVSSLPSVVPSQPAQPPLPVPGVQGPPSYGQPGSRPLSYVPPVGIAPPQPPQIPVKLTEGIPDPAEIAKQKDGYAKGIDMQFRQGSELLNSQHKQTTEWLHSSAEQRKQQYILAVDQQVKQEELQLSQKYNEQLMLLHQAAQRQRAELEQQANNLALEYQTRKTQEDYMEQQYGIQKTQYESQMKMFGELQQLGVPVPMPVPNVPVAIGVPALSPPAAPPWPAGPPPSSGSLSMPPGSLSMPPGSLSMPPGSLSMPPGSLSMPPGSLSVPPGSVSMPPGSMPPNSVSIPAPPGSWPPPSTMSMVSPPGTAYGAMQPYIPPAMAPPPSVSGYGGIPTRSSGPETNGHHPYVSHMQPAMSPRPVQASVVALPPTQAMPSHAAPGASAVQHLHPPTVTSYHPSPDGQYVATFKPGGEPNGGHVHGPRTNRR